MPFPSTAYRNIPSTGLIPVDMVPADQISFAYSFTYEKSYNSLEGFLSVLKGRVVLELRDSNKNLKATFDLTESYNITIFSLADGLVFYFWEWYANAEKYIAKDADGNDIEVESLAFEPPDPPSGSGESDRAAYVISKFYSPAFLENVEEGDTLKIKFHDLSAGTVVARASLQVATRLGDTGSPALVDNKRGQQLRVIQTQSGTQKQNRVVRTRRLDSPLALANTQWSSGTDGVLDAPKFSASQIDQVGAMQYVLGTTTDNAMILWNSTDAAKTWTQVMNEPATLKILAARLVLGGRYIVYGIGSDKQPAYAILKHGANGWNTSESGACTLDPPTSSSTNTDAPPAKDLPTNKINSLEEGDGGVLRLLSTDKDGTLRLFLSRDGKTWSESPTAPQ